MTSFWIPTPTEGCRIGRRAVVLGLCAALALPMPSAAFGLSDARTLVDQLVAEVNATINSGKPEEAMLRDFERIFANRADVPAIARSALGPAARTATPAQMRDYTAAFQRYIARKYGRRFREFIGGQIEVTGARPLRNYFEVTSIARLRGQAPFDLRWHVTERGGRPLFFNLIIEGVNMLAAERTEIGAMLDRRRGDIAALTADLRAM
ncbi:MAG: phospholipid-binding protein MlaC [Gemmobacter sp.]